MVYPDGTAIANTYDEWNRQVTGHGVTTKTYNAANQLLSLNGNPITYNSMNQITGMNGMSFDYYPNGQIKSEVTGSAATIYTYDSLKRLSTATNYLNGTAQRAQAYTYDGWGNLTNKTPTLGTAQSLTLNIDPATNRVIQTPACYDANGNMIGAPPSCSPSLNYDVSNRIATVTGGPTYSYDAKNKRISTLHADGTEELFFYGPNGRKISTIHLSPYADSGPTNNIIYFAGRIVGNSSGALIQDRRGSIGAYDPWGEDPNNTGNDTEKFATYTRDGATGLDYADQRYYTSQFGRFMSADPYQASGGPSDPWSWNRYTYVLNDPINYQDRKGLLTESPDPRCVEGTCSDGGDGSDDEEYFYQGSTSPTQTHKRPIDTVTDVLARSALTSRLANFSNSNCDKVFRSVIDGYRTGDFIGRVSTTEFYNAKNPQFSRYTQNDVSGNGVGEALGSLNVTARVLRGTLGDAVLLGANFFSNPNSVYQSNILLHELLHVYTNGWSDLEIFAAFGRYGLNRTSSVEDSEDISSWLSTDCHSTPISLTWWVK